MGETTPAVQGTSTSIWGSSGGTGYETGPMARHLLALAIYVLTSV